MSTPFSDAGNAMFPPPEARLEVVRPRDEKELAAILRLAREAGTSVTAAAARTGLAGGAVPAGSGLCVELGEYVFLPDRPGYRRATPFLLISETDPHRGIVAPGATLRDLNAALETLGLWYPPHPGELRATLGGNVATNASGPRTFAFGATRAYVESLRVILADGDVLALERGRDRVHDGRFALRTESGRVIEGAVPEYALPAIKNAAGLAAAPDMDAVDLFIGSDGILGVLGEIGLRFLPRRPLRAHLLFLADGDTALDFAEALRPLKAERDLYPHPAGNGVVSLEFFDSGSLELARAAGQAVPAGARAAIEFEYFADDAETPARAFAFSERFRCAGSLPAAEIEAFRYAVPRRVAELLKERGRPKFGTDFAVPPASFRTMYAFHAAVDAEFGVVPGSVRTAKWGHVGDCHLHCNFLCESAEDEALAKVLYLKLVRKALVLGGTVSAEHGVGKKRLADEAGVERPYLWYMLGDAGLEQIAAVKRAFDPDGLLNAGNMIPAKPGV